MKPFRTCLLLLLSLLLPVQAALAAGAAGCLRHVSQGPLTSTMATAKAADEAAVEVAAQDRSACAQHAAGAMQAPAGGQVAGVDAGAGAGADADCNSCGLCCMASAMPSQALLWQATHMQQAHAAKPAATQLSTVGRTLDRPPRASATAR